MPSLITYGNNTVIVTKFPIIYDTYTLQVDGADIDLCVQEQLAKMRLFHVTTS